MMERVNYSNLPNCYKISNDLVEVVVTTEVGPRILKYSYKNGLNILEDSTELAFQTNDGIWKAIGGHRLSVAPESVVRSYSLDNLPIETKIIDPLTIHLLQPTDSRVGIQKEIRIRLDPATSQVTLDHRITNRGICAIDLAPWCLTIMRGGGIAVVPQEPYIAPFDDLLPARTIALWHYTDLTDSRIDIGKKYVRVSVDRDRKEPQKIGFMNKQGWVGYLLDKHLFLKRFTYQGGASYPDYGSNNEIYTSADYIEIETLAPIHHLEPGDVADHTETWYLYNDIIVGLTEETMHTAIAELISLTAEDATFEKVTKILPSW